MRDKQKINQEIKEKKAQDKQSGLRIHKEDFKANIVFMKQIFNDVLVYDLKSIGKKGKNIFGLKDS